VDALTLGWGRVEGGIPGVSQIVDGITTRAHPEPLPYGITTRAHPEPSPSGDESKDATIMVQSIVAALGDG